jgi:hypothetical protein
VGALNLSKPGARHPGQDYRCHCEMEFLTNEEVARLGLTLPDSNPPKSSEEVAKSYGLFQNLTPIEWIKKQFLKVGRKLGIVETFATVEEAQIFMNTKLAVKVNYEDLELSEANFVNSAVFKVKKDMGEFIPSIKFLTEENFDYLGLYSPKEKSLKLNYNSPFWKNPKKFMLKNAKSFSTKNQYHLFYHENFHYKMAKEQPILYSKLQNQFFKNLEDIKLIKTYLSYNATLDYLEFVTEYKVKELLKLKIDNRIQKLYRKIMKEVLIR